MLTHVQNPAVIAAIAGAGAVLCLWGFFRRLRRDRLLADTPLVHIRSAAQGYVKVAGHARPAGAAPTAAPLSGRPCVWWDFRIAERQRDSRGREQWHTVESATSVELFVLADDDAQCLVGPVKAEVTPSRINTWYGNGSRPLGGPPPVNTALLMGPYRYTERLLEVGAQVCVVGELRSHSETGDLAAATAARLHEWKQDQAALLKRFDADHDGQLSATEWEAARAAAAKECETQKLQSTIARTSVISEPADGRPFLISPRGPEGMEKREWRMAWLYFAVGLACVWACAWALQQAGAVGGP
ncbi:MAG TPA: GIDE domain-containing protein [Steroidobacteraceae bacterium]|nr:GIDE domain-containing protein [Steroidobacteraceae bacterium]